MPDFKTIDFHSHHVGPQWRNRQPPVDREAQQRWNEIYEYLYSVEAALEQVERGDLEARLLNTPLAFLGGEEADIPLDVLKSVNDHLAGLTVTHRGKLYALATIDAFTGEAGAREAHRAVVELGLSGLFIESAKGDLLLDAPQARPTLAAAAELNVPVFVHPVNPQPFTRRLSVYGRTGTLLARGSINAASLVALLATGVFEELPGLRVVITTIGIAGLTLSATFDHAARFLDGTAPAARQHVYIDTMGFNPKTIAHAIDLLGVDHVLAGSDWPVLNTGPISARLDAALETLQLPPASRQAIASGNLKRLLARSAL